MKLIQKYLSVAAFTALLFCIAVYVSPKAPIPLPRFVVPGAEGSGTQDISIFDAGDGNYYVFLPSYAQMEQVTVSQPSYHHFSLEEIPLAHGMNCGIFQTETPYAFAVDHRQTATLRFFQSANVATMYVDTVSGNMKYLHQNKDHRETVSVSLYASDGSLCYTNGQSTLKGRGNATWEYDKRPYALTLPADAALLDMAPAAKWILLANAADETNLNNKLVFDLARQVGFQWTPQCRWIDLYLNGEYSGLYLLMEKVEVHENRLDIDTGAGDFLCRVDLDSRRSSLQNPFSSGAGRTVEISSPEIPDLTQLTEIENRVNQMEQEILSGADLRKSGILDLDSWVRRYLIDEISANIDSDIASCYFYCSDGVFYAGPLWDYDMTFGNYPRNHDPHAFVAKNAQKSDTVHSAYYGALYNNESFYSRMVELYRREFVPVLQQLLNEELDQAIDFIHKASQSNSLRWRFMYDNLPANVVHTPSALKEYLVRRIQFLDRAWLDDVPFCTVQFELSPGSSYLSISVEKGHCLESSYINTDPVLRWVNPATGEAFDFRQPVMEDMILSLQTE